ncbi:AhpA/YtjB family protein [Pseudidiomarina mangrovi]|uniref:AhpA/YtjB family protein n=1 Tax=Pseudidiomarina mangrovi TaxID=2487133 RepID=UPI000FC9B91B|nr:AhpA/YtjB family protein [Pseudidiomarina mangrovi]
MKIESHHVISIIQVVYRRTRRFIVALLLILLIEQLWTSMQANSLEALRQHSHQLLQLTSQQTALSARALMMNNDQDGLQQLVEQTLQHPYIISASIRNNYGQLLVSSSSEGEQPNADRASTVLVETIIDEQRNLGFLQLVVDNTRLLESPNKTHAYLSYFGQFLLAFAVLAGIFIAITFNRWRYRLSNNRLANNR